MKNSPVRVKSYLVPINLINMAICFVRYAYSRTDLGHFEAPIVWLVENPRHPGLMGVKLNSHFLQACVTVQKATLQQVSLSFFSNKNKLEK